MICKELVALITGGASGLGKATAQRLIKEGNKVVICDLASSKGQEVATELGQNARFCATDVTSEKDVAEAVTFTAKTFHKLNVVVNCAGITVATKAYNFLKKQPHELDDFVRVLSVNTIGTFNVVRLSAALINNNQVDSENQKGVIVNTSAYAAYEGSQGQVAFAASKAAVAGMTLPLARDFGSAGIRVVGIVPGLFDTPFMHIFPEKFRAFLAKSMIFPNRLGKPDEFAMLVQHIIENPYLNATNIRIDAGFRML